MNGTYYYYTGSGNKAVGDKFIPIRNGATTNRWFHFGTDGKMYTGWRNDGGSYRYYAVMKDDGTGSDYINQGGNWDDLLAQGFERGSMIQANWGYIYSKPSNAWFWYYFDENGWMLANTSRNINGKVYHFDANGHCTNP